MYDVSWCCWLVRKRQYSTSVFLQTWMDSQEFCGFVCVCGYTTRSLYTLVNIHSSERQHDLWLESVLELQYPLHSSHNDCVSNPKPWVKQYSFHTPYMTSKPATRMQAMNTTIIQSRNLIWSSLPPPSHLSTVSFLCAGQRPITNIKVLNIKSHWPKYTSEVYHGLMEGSGRKRKGRVKEYDPSEEGVKRNQTQ